MADLPGNDAESRASFRQRPWTTLPQQRRDRRGRARLAGAYVVFGSVRSTGAAAPSLIDDLRAELTTAVDTSDARLRMTRFGLLLESFVQDWRQLCALHGVGGRARSDFVRLAEAVRQAAAPLAAGLVMRTNNAGALLVLEKRVLQHLVVADEARA